MPTSTAAISTASTNTTTTQSNVLSTFPITGPLLSQKPVVLWFHDPGTYSNQDAVVNPDQFPNFRDGQLLRIHFLQQTQQQQSQQQSTSQNKSSVTQKQQAGGGGGASSQQQQQQQSPQRPPIIVKAGLADREALTRQQHLQISISRDIADRFNLRSRLEVYLELIDPSAAALDHVELSFKEQYLGRSDMWRLQQHLRGTCVYAEKKIVYAGVIKATIRRQFSNDVEMMSGYIDENTRMIFRSSSAKYFVFIQMSREMWEFDEDGELYYEKVVYHFLPELFQKWKEEGTNHVVSFVLFTRVFYDDPPVDDPLVIKTEDGRYYKDFYKVVADWETVDDWMAIIGPLKDEQLKFQQSVLMRHGEKKGDQESKASLSGRISIAYEGNVLEAVNLALNPFDNHYVDRDLMRTGLSVILVTPGPGKFEASKKLLRLTNERMTDNGIAMDLVCLSPLPLHVTPLFVYKSSPPPNEILQEQLHLSATQQRYKGGTGGSPETKTLMMSKHKTWDPMYEDDALPNTYTYYSVPHWIDCSFYSQGNFLQKRDKFRTRCKMYELQMMGIMEHDLAGISIPYLSQQQEGSSSSSSSRLRTQRSSSSLNDKLSKSIDSTTGNSEAYLSRSANFASMRQHHSLLQQQQQQQQLQQQQGAESNKLAAADYARYDAAVFKDSPEPRFGRRIPASSTPTQKLLTPTKQKNSFESPDRGQDTENWLMKNNAGLKSNMTWHHGDQRRMMSILSQSQQAGSKITFDSNVHKDDHPMRASDIFKGTSPGRNTAEDGTTATRIRTPRRGTLNSSNIGLAVDSPSSSNMAVDDEDLMLVSSSTVDPVPIKGGLGGSGIGNAGRGVTGVTTTAGGGGDARKSNNPSPRQVGSVPSVHKHSGNSDAALRTSFGGQYRTSSSPLHSSAITGRNNALRNVMINPCNPSDYTMLFTSHLRRWLHALPRVDQYDGPRVHWRSLTCPACLPLTTDYFPSNEELKKDYRHYMYTVSASEDVNLYQAGDRSISEHKRTANLLQEMISQRLAQGFQIIVDVTGSSHNHHHHYHYPQQQQQHHVNHFKSITASSGATTNAYDAVGGHTGTTKDVNNTLFTSSTSGPLPSSGIPATTNTVVGGGGLAAPSAAVAAATSGSGSGSGVPGGGGTTTTSTTTIAMSKTIARSDAEEDTAKWKHMVWWLSMGYQVHQLTFDSSCQNVEVRRYVRQITFDTKKTGYKCAIWPKNLSTYRPKSVSFSYPSLLYAWNYLDHLVAGYQDELTDNLRFWRARFIVIPRETLPANTPLSTHIGASSLNTLDDEEKRLALFDIWLQNLRKAKSLSPQEREEMHKNRRRKELAVSDFGLRITTMDPSAYVTNEAIKPVQQPPASTSNNGDSPLFSHPSTSSLLSSIGGTLSQQLGLSRDSKSKDIAQAMRDPKAGLRMADRRWHFKVYTYSFIGSEFVDWIIGQFDDINTREDAVAFGNALMQRKPPLFVSSTSRHSFLDGHYFYRLHNEYLPKQQQQQQTQRTWFTMKSKTSSPATTANTSSAAGSSSSTPSLAGSDSKDKEVNSGTGSPALNTTNNQSQQQQQQGSSSTTQQGSSSGVTPPRRRRRSVDFEMTREMIIDVDPYKKSDRRETAILHYDTIHNANNCYHFQINWLGCMAQLVQELVQNWSRQAERCGLLVVEGSVDQAYDDSENNNPFQCPVPIDLAVKPPSVTELNAAAAASGENNGGYGIPDNIYEAALVRHMGFVLDVEADSKFDRALAEGVHAKYTYHKEPYKYDQYIHRSGVAFVQIRHDNKGFYWVNNRLYTNHTPSLVMMGRRRAAAAASSTEGSNGSTNMSNMHQQQHPELLRQQFQDFCSDATRLAEFWETTRHNLLAEHHTGTEAWVFENAQVVLSGDADQQQQQQQHSSVQTPTMPSSTTTAIQEESNVTPSETTTATPSTTTATTTTTTTAVTAITENHATPQPPAQPSAPTPSSAKSPSVISDTDSSNSNNNPKPA